MDVASYTISQICNVGHRDPVSELVLWFHNIEQSCDSSLGFINGLECKYPWIVAEIFSAVYLIANGLG